MHITLIKHIEELSTELSLLQSDEVTEEANANMYTFGISEELLQQYGANSVTTFLIEVSNLYGAQCKSQMLFYSWFDEMASQIRVSAVSKKHGKPPFGCNIEPCELEQLVAGIFSGNGGLFIEPNKLLVWQKQI
jgi:hypothetical protein